MERPPKKYVCEKCGYLGDTPEHEGCDYLAWTTGEQLYIDHLETELETERMRLAGCGVAALGYFDGCKEEYRSASLDDTLRLYAKYEKQAAALKLARDTLDYYTPMIRTGESPAEQAIAAIDSLQKGE